MTPRPPRARFDTVLTDPADLREFLQAERPGLVVFETCTVAGWVADLCPSWALAFAVANPMHEAWSWRKVKRKTDRDDALKLARMAALGELPTVPMPAREAREYRALVKYRDRLVGRRTAVQNHIRAACQRHGVLLPAGHRAWTKEGLELIASMATAALRECGPEELWRGELALELRELEALTAAGGGGRAAARRPGAADERVQLLRTIPGVGPLHRRGGGGPPRRRQAVPHRGRGVGLRGAGAAGSSSPARWTAGAGSRGAGRGCCARCWWRRRG